MNTAVIKRPLRVALISPTFGGYGGLEAFVLTLAAGLPDHSGCELTVGFKRAAGFTLRPELADACASLGARVRFLDRGSRDLYRLIAWADVVHVQNPCPDAVFLARLRRRPLLINVINHRLPGVSWRQRLWDFCLRRAQRRFYISDFVRRTWEGPQSWPRSEVVFPICRLAHGVASPETRRGFVFAARWIANKGADTLIEAYARAALDPVEWPLVMIGDGPLRPEIERIIHERKLPGITTPGFLPEDAKAAAIRAARWMVVPPDTREDFGLTAIEARHLGVPCIITLDGGLPEAAGPGALTCEPGDIDGLAACLRVAAAMPPQAYAALSAETRRTLLPALARPDFYAATYRALAPSAS